MAGMVPLGRGVIMADEEVSGRVVRDLAHELGGDEACGVGNVSVEPITKRENLCGSDIVSK